MEAMREGIAIAERVMTIIIAIKSSIRVKPACRYAVRARTEREGGTISMRLDDRTVLPGALESGKSAKAFQSSANKMARNTGQRRNPHLGLPTSVEDRYRHNNGTHPLVRWYEQWFKECCLST